MSGHVCSCACTVVDDKLISLCGLHAAYARDAVDESTQQRTAVIVDSIRSTVGDPVLLLIATRDDLLRKLGAVLLTLDASQK